MARRVRQRQCPRCGTVNEGKAKQCTSCGTWLVKKRFAMNKDRVRLVHTLANRKGLDDELYRLNLQAVGVDSCKAMKKAQFEEFLARMARLPDAPRRAAA